MSLVESARNLMRRTDRTGVRLEALESAVAAMRGRIDAEYLAGADEILQRSADRLRLSGDHTVVALAGATGSGKSSTFNALAGMELASVGVRRPTTSWATACSWGPGAEDLLTWLGIEPRHQVVRDSVLDGESAHDLDGLVLLDLPDHDSTEVAHHLEMERLVGLADVVAWVVDPQKYADAALHDRFLKSMAGHGDVMMVVLNRIDEVEPDRRGPMISDLKRLLDLDGLTGVPVFAVSASTGEGMDELRKQIARRVAAKSSVRERVSADIAVVARELAEVSGDAPTPEVTTAARRSLSAALAEAAGVPSVAASVRHTSRIRTRRATGWPLTAWLGRFRKRQAPNLTESGRMEPQLRDFADSISADMKRPWQLALREAATSQSEDVARKVGRVVAETNVDFSRVPWWARIVQLTQWVLLLGAITGGLWLIGLSFGEFLRIPDLPEWEWRDWPVPTLMLLGGLAAGVVLALISRVLVAISSRLRARKARKRLHRGIAEVAERLVVEPVLAELGSYETAAVGLRSAR